MSQPDLWGPTAPHHPPDPPGHEAKLPDLARSIELATEIAEMARRTLREVRDHRPAPDAESDE